MTKYETIHHVNCKATIQVVGDNEQNTNCNPRNTGCKEMTLHRRHVQIK